VCVDEYRLPCRQFKAYLVFVAVPGTVWQRLPSPPFRPNSAHIIPLFLCLIFLSTHPEETLKEIIVAGVMWQDNCGKIERCLRYICIIDIKNIY
jgi:hypothetical protein